MSNSSRNIVETISEYGSRLFGFIRGRVRSEEDAEDILQEVWFQLSRIIDLEEIENISGWLFQVARNRITDLYRKQAPLKLEDLFENEGAFVKEILLEEDSVDDTGFKEIFWDVLREALNELPDKQREVFVSNELEGLTLQEIADQSDENLKTIISRKRYAVLHLRNRLEELYRNLND